MKVKCIHNKHLENHITQDKIYDVIREEANSYMIIDNDGDRLPYIKKWFEIVEEKTVEEIEALNDGVIDYKMKMAIVNVWNRWDQENRNLCFEHQMKKSFYENNLGEPYAGEWDHKKVETHLEHKKQHNKASIFIGNQEVF